MFQKTHLFIMFKGCSKIQKIIIKAEGVLLAKKAFNKKNFRDPKNEGSNLVKTYLQLMGVPKTHLFRIWQNFKMRFLGKRSFLEKFSETPKMGIQIRSKLLICFNLTKKLNYAFSTERVLSWKIIGNINCFAYLEVQIRLYCLKRVPKKFCSKILEVGAPT